MRRIHPVLAAVLAFTLLLPVACNRSRSGEDSAEEQTQAQGDGSAGEASVPEMRRPEAGGEGVAPDGAVPMRLTDQGRARREQPVVSPADPRDTGFESGRLTAVAFHPMDTVLGPLGGVGVSARDRAVMSAGRELLVPLLSGELPTGQLSRRIGPGGRAVLDNLIWASGTLSEVRLGVVVPLTEREVSLPFRMLGESTAVMGEVILERVDDRWYTADVQVEFSDRDSTRRFDPGTVQSIPKL